jgi:hypothetical protein
MILRSHQRTKDPEIKKYWTAQQLQHQTAMVQVFLYIYSIVQDPQSKEKLARGPSGIVSTF